MLISSSAIIGKRCTIGGATTVLGHLNIVDDVHISAMSLVVSSINDPGEYASATPLDDVKQWRKNHVRMRQLDAMARRLHKVESRLDKADDEGSSNS
ncbi:MAG: hypothetical protein AAF420_10495 [Pseudomonadota bacterium]